MNRNPRYTKQFINEKLGETPESVPRDDSRSEETTTAGMPSDNINNVGGKTDVGKRIVSPEEFAAAAGHSGKFNIVVEGETDVEVYEKLIALIGIQDVDCYYAGNREELFKVYLEIKRNNNSILKRVAFIADQDSWIFLDKQPPIGYDAITIDDIIWTEGYSLENDLYVMGSLKKLVLEKHQKDYQKTVESICTWYAFKVANLHPGDSLPVKSLTDIVPHTSVDLEEGLRKKVGRLTPSLIEKIEEIKNKYDKLIPGKTLFHLLSRFLNRSGFPFTYGPKSYALLVRIAITFSPTWSSSFKEKLEHKLPGLKKRLASSKIVNKIVAENHREGAVKSIKKFIEEDSDYNGEMEGHLEFGCMLERFSQYDAAIEFIKKTIESNPKDPLAYTILSKCYLGKDMIVEARDALAQLEQILMEVSRSNA